MSTEDGNYNWSLLAMQGREQHPGEPPKYITPYMVTLYSQWANIFQNNLWKAFNEAGRSLKIKWLDFFQLL